MGDLEGEGARENRGMAQLDFPKFQMPIPQLFTHSGVVSALFQQTKFLGIPDLLC